MAHHISSPARLEAFSDGVIAVIITIMVLELKVPHQDGVAGFYAVLPTLCVYAISFAFTALYWVNHHTSSTARTRRRTHPLRQSLFLFCLSLLPFSPPTRSTKSSTPSRSLSTPHPWLSPALSFMLLRLAIGRRLRLAGKLEEEEPQSSKSTGCRSSPTSSRSRRLYYPHAALGLIAFVTVIWITPTAGVKPHEEDGIRPTPC